MERADVVIVGAGVMGSAAAWWLARRGRRVVALEQFPRGHARGSSHGSTRIFRFAYRDPLYVGLAKEALPLWRELEAEAGTRIIETTGGVDHGDPGSIDEVEAALAASDAAYERLDPAEAHRRWPGMRFDAAVVSQPDAGRCRADAAVRAFQDRAVAYGADLRFDTGPARVDLDDDGDGVRIGTATGELVAPAAVVTAGAWAQPTLGGLVPLPPLRVTREQLQHFAPKPHDATAWPSFIHHPAPWRYGLLAPGEGVKVAFHMSGAEVVPESGAERDAEAERRTVDYVNEWFPGLDPTPVHLSTCLYTTTANEDFVIDRAGPIVIGSPCSGHGFKFAPLVGRMLADLVDGGEPPHHRFVLPRL